MSRPGLSVILLFVSLALGAPAAWADDGQNPRRNRVVRVVERASPAIVSIKTSKLAQRDWFEFLRPFRLDLPGGSRLPKGALGSGTIFHPRGFVITNAHVIQHASDLIVELKSGPDAEPEALRARAVAVDLPNDLAILRILQEGQGARTFPHVPLGRSHDLMVGETVIAVGHPLKLGLTVTRGILSARGRTLRLGRHVFDDFLQVDAPVNRGNSGGPLFDITGRWIGVNTAIYRRDTHEDAEGIGFAIPIDRVRALMAATFKRRLVTGTWFGIELIGGDDGEARVQAVFPKGPAAHASLQPEDVIVRINGQDTPTLYDVRLALVEIPLGGVARLGVERKGAPLDRDVPLVDVALPTAELTNAHLGLVVQDMDADGVMVVQVREGGPGARAQLRPNDVIRALGGFKIDDTDDLLRFLQFVKAGDLVDVRVLRMQRFGSLLRSHSLKGVIEAD